MTQNSSLIIAENINV